MRAAEPEKVWASQSKIFREYANRRDIKPLNLVGGKNPILHRRAVSIDAVDPDVIELALRMIATLGRHPGHALAAPQVGNSVRLVVTPTVAIANPRISHEPDVGMLTEAEGCLSLPGRWYEVPRPAEATVWGIDIATGRPWKAVVAGLQARIWSHEVDHLDGLLISDWCAEVRAPSH